MATATEVAEQRALEALSVGFTRARIGRWQDRYQKQRQATDEALNDLEKALPAVAAEVEKWKNGQKNKRRKPEAFGVIQALGSDVAAFIGLSTCYGMAHREPEVRKVCYEIGYVAEQQVWGLNLQQHNPELFNRIFKIVKNRHSIAKLKAKSARIIAKKAGFFIDFWGPSKRIAVGRDILQCVLMSNVFGLIEDGPIKLVITPETKDNLAKQTDRQIWMNLLYLPMVIPPKPWVAVNSGPYVTRRMSRQVPLVRTHNKEHVAAVQRAIEDDTAKPFMEALNAIQAVPLRINEPVLELVKWAYVSDIQAGKLPRRTYLPKPDRLEDGQLSDMARKAARLKHSKIAQINRAIDADAVMMERDLETAKLLAGRPFWLPHNVDFRGRCYPVPSFNHQRSDHIKALFNFEAHKQLGASGAYWLAVHLANVGDFDKVSKKPFEERVRWVYDNENFIFQTAANPFEHQGWTEADKPFQFYAACREWAEYLHNGESPETLSNLPVSVDGSNSGLQHYSALLRSRPDADKVSLTERDQPSDLYSIVAERVNSVVEQERTNPLAEHWLAFGITRKIVKRNVMTFPYSSETFGFKEQLMEDLMIPLEYEVLTGERARHPFGDQWGDWARASFYLAKHVWRAVNDVVRDAGRGMDFLQGIAGACAKEGKSVEWVTPVGFPVIHRYNEYKSNQVKLWFDYRGARLTQSVRVNECQTPVIRKVKQSNAIAPNLIHSLDAAHLMLTTLRAKAEGISDFLFIHDCFGSHAGNMGRFSQIVREAFVEMYEQNDPLGDLWRLAVVNTGNLPEPPILGDFDVREVLRAEYAFA